MKSIRILPLLSGLLIAVSCGPPQKAAEERKQVRIDIEEKNAAQRVEVLVEGKLFTTYRWPDNVCKPILFPLMSPGGTPVTRGFPLEPREGERNDHRHQAGNWLNYGNVNGVDFWGNGHRGEKEPNGGVIRHLGVEKMSGGDGQASMVVRTAWQDSDGQTILTERTEFHFFADDSSRIVDRITTLTANKEQSVHFKDTKEGMFAIRVARQLELPSDEKITLTDAHGNPRAAKESNNGEATGNYRSSEGITGEKVWGTRARWMALWGNVSGENISLVIFDHPRNLNYPTYWHARGYGLFAANPLGAHDFTGGREALNHTLLPGDSLTFRYRILLHNGDLGDDGIDSVADEFTERY